ncbi:hypothetical protein [Streptomyces sp. NPDC003863]
MGYFGTAGDVDTTRDAVGVEARGGVEVEAGIEVGGGVEVEAGVEVEVGVEVGVGVGGEETTGWRDGPGRGSVVVGSMSSSAEWMCGRGSGVMSQAPFVNVPWGDIHWLSRDVQETHT